VSFGARSFKVLFHGDASAKLTKSEEVGAGIVGGTLACWNHPFEVARIEAQARAAAGQPALSMPAVMRMVVAESGVTGLFTGLVPRVMLGIWQTLFMVTGACSAFLCVLLSCAQAVWCWRGTLFQAKQRERALDAYSRGTPHDVRASLRARRSQAGEGRAGREVTRRCAALCSFFRRSRAVHPRVLPAATRVVIRSHTCARARVGLALRFSGGHKDTHARARHRAARGSNSTGLVCGGVHKSLTQ
jgi:hypothetical protein